jgi:DNA-binding response OmpR family regulator
MSQMTAPASPPPPRATRARSSPSDEPRRILVIDDELDHAEIVAALLRRDGHEVEIASDATAGLERARLAPPDLVLLDFYMPAVDGFVAAARLKADPRTREVPIIFLSACGDLAAAARGLDLGSVDYLPKPFHAAELLELASTVLAGRR